MHKEELFRELSAKVANGEISPEEIASRLNLVAPPPIASATGGLRAGGEETRKLSHFSVTKMLYVLGGVMVIIGIVYFVAQIWEDIGAFGRITVTLGLGLLFAAIGSVLLVQKPQDAIGSLFHFIGGMLIPGGALVTLSEFEVDIDSLWPVAITFGFIFVFYLLLSAAQRHAILTFFAIANGTAFVYLLVGAIIEGQYYYNEDDIFAYLTMLIGVSYLLLAYAFREGWNRHLINALHLFGSGGVLGAAFSRVFDSRPWELFYFLLVLGGLFLSVYMKSRSILVLSALFLVAHITYITSEYFANSLGWPISLVILGFVFIGLGYASVTINKKYIAHTA